MERTGTVSRLCQLTAKNPAVYWSPPCKQTQRDSVRSANISKILHLVGKLRKLWKCRFELTVLGKKGPFCHRGTKPCLKEVSQLAGNLLWVKGVKENHPKAEMVYNPVETCDLGSECGQQFFLLESQIKRKTQSSLTWTIRFMWWMIVGCYLLGVLLIAWNHLD